jgi:hypothetical protein
MSLRLFLILVFISINYSSFTQDLPPATIRENRTKLTIYDVWESKPVDLTGHIPLKKEFVTTFVSVSYYYPAPADDVECRVLFRKAGTPGWEPAFKPVHQKEYLNFRGSIVNLEENTQYEIKALFTQNGILIGEEIDTVKTWSEYLPVDRTISIHDFASNNYEINVSGEPGKWIRITGDKTPVEGGSSREAAINIEGQRFLILENIVIKGGHYHGIDLINCSNIRIINCDISGWGRKGVPSFRPEGVGKYRDENGAEINRDAGIHTINNEKIVIERCYIHDPRGRANPWYYAHPEGPVAIYLGSDNTNGNYVIRYNDFVGSELNRWNDAVMGFGNGQYDGSAYRDSDIYGNFFSLSNDDGIELDGGQMNIRVFGNKFIHSLCGISTAPNMIGPSYIFRNVISDLNDETGRVGAMVKNGGGRKYSSGLTVFINNTFVSKGLGIRSVGMGREKDRATFRGFSRNNIIVVDGSEYTVVGDIHNTPEHDLDFDLLWNLEEETFKNEVQLDFDNQSNRRRMGNVIVQGHPGIEKNAIVANPQFFSIENYRFDLQKSSPAIGTAVPVNNFTISNNVSDADKGAYEYGIIKPLPFRPVPIYADKNRVVLSETTGIPAQPEHVTLFCEGLEPGSRNFQLKINQAYHWLDVEPSSGTFPENGSIEFIVKINREAQVNSFSEEGSFFVRLDNGYSIPIVVKAELKGGKAENMNWKLPKNIKTGQVITKEFVVEKEGIYHFYMKAGKSKSGPPNARYWLWLNQEIKTEDRSSGTKELNEKTNWIPAQLASNNGRSADKLFLDKGLNRLDFQLIDQMKVDEIIISSDPFFMEK